MSGLELCVFTDLYDLYLAVPDSDTLLLAQGDGALPRQLLEETIDRRLNGAELDESLARLLMQTGPIGFLVARYPETENAAQGFPSPRFSARAVPRQSFLPVGVNQFCRFTSVASPRCWAALVQ